MHQASILHRASSRDMYQSLFSHSCCRLPLNDSTVALSLGVPGLEKSIWPSPSYTNLSSIFQQIQSRYEFSATVVRDVWGQWCSSLRSPLSADSGPRRSQEIRVCRDQWLSAGVTDARQIRHQKKSPCPRHDTDTAPARFRVGKYAYVYPASPPALA